MRTRESPLIQRIVVTENARQAVPVPPWHVMLSTATAPIELIRPQMLSKRFGKTALAETPETRRRRMWTQPDVKSRPAANCPVKIFAAVFIDPHASWSCMDLCHSPRKWRITEPELI